MTTCSSLSWAELYRRALERMRFESLGHLLLLVWLVSSVKPRSHSHTTKLLFILRGIICASLSTYCQKHHLIHEQLLQNKAMNQFLTAESETGTLPINVTTPCKDYLQMYALYYFMPALRMVSALQLCHSKKTSNITCIKVRSLADWIQATYTGNVKCVELVLASTLILDWSWNQLPEVKTNSAFMIHFSFMNWKNWLKKETWQQWVKRNIP